MIKQTDARKRYTRYLKNMYYSGNTVNNAVEDYIQELETKLSMYEVAKIIFWIMFMLNIVLIIIALCK